MAKIKLTKNELKKQKDALKRFNRYLPTLKLKKQQLQLEIGKVKKAMSDIADDIQDLRNSVNKWVDVFAEDVNLSELIKVDEVETETGNIAGIDIPLFLDVKFDEADYDYFIIPMWVDKAIEVIKQMISLNAQYQILQKQEDILQEELRITVQRVNLFEKVKIPETKENIRVIRIYLGDEQTAEVVRGKIAKSKIEKKKEQVAV